MNVLDARSVGWYITHYSENFKFLKEYYKNDVEGVRKVLVYGLCTSSSPDPSERIRGRYQINLLCPINEKQDRIIKEREERMKASDKALAKLISRL